MRVLLTLALAVMCISYFMAEKQVTLADDGRVIKVKTFAPTVGAALVRLGITVKPGDRVLPSPRSNLDNKIEVRRARDVVVVLNGSRRVEKVTGRTVEQVLEELSVSSKGALIEPAPKAPIGEGEEIVVAQPVQTTVVHDGIAQPVVTNVLTAGALLRQLGLVLGPFDRVEPSIVAQPAPGTTITLVRVNEAVETVTASIPFKQINTKSDQLPIGTQKVQTPGTAGLKALSYKIVYENGVPKTRKLVQTQVIKPPVDQVTLVGTKRPVLTAISGNTQSGKASWYNIGGLTAAHRSLPFGTVVRVTNLANGKTVTVTIQDRGPFVSGRIIDLSESAFAEIASTSTGVINVKIEW